MELLGPKIIMTGDHISPVESAVLIMNHRTRVDWNFLWGAMYQACMPHVGNHKLKFILKDSIKQIPGAGTTLHLCFVKVKAILVLGKNSLQKIGFFPKRGQ